MTEALPVLIVLAGGFGTRLQPVVSDQPKILAPIAGEPYLAHFLRWCVGKGIQRLHLCLGYRAEQVIDWLAQQHWPLQISWQSESRPLGTGGALQLALQQAELKAVSDGVLVCNGDTFVEFDLTAFVRSAEKSGGGILTVQVTDASRYGAVQANSQRLLTGFQEKNNNAQPGEINAGWYFFGPQHVHELRARQLQSLELDYLMVGQKPPISCLALGQQFIDFGTPDSYQQAQVMFKDLA
jgi:NDP-sugar pyrophosphorylase family protein